MRVVAALPLLVGCELVFPLDDDRSAEQTHNLAFVTSKVFEGNLGGLAGADAICQDAAERGELAPNTYIAWLSDAQTNAIDRLQDARGWVRVDGQPVADFPSELGTRGPRVPISRTELGEDVRTISNVWTGSFADGTKEEDDRRCSEWTSTAGEGRFGDPELGAGQLTTSGTADCTATQRLYCFGIELAQPVEPSAPAGPLFFVSSRVWNTIDADAADQICATEASAAALPGTFAAVLARPGQELPIDPQSEFYRVDGVRLGAVLTGAEPNTFPFLTANGSVANGTNEVWTGGLGFGTAETTCNDWTRTGTGTSGFRHIATMNMFVETTRLACDHDAYVYCAQRD